MLLFAFGCEPATLTTGSDKAPRDSREVAEDSGDSGDSGHTADSAELACTELSALPVQETHMDGFTGAEDFAFNEEGYLVSIDLRGNLVAINQALEEYVILPGATAFGAGTRFLPTGEIVFADAEKGNLVRVDPNAPAAIVVLSGLEYPNGLDVDTEGYVYVSEQNAGRVRRIDPFTGAYSIVMEGLYNPNGVTFSPDYNTIYVGSFGAGVVWAADRQSDDSFSEPRIYASTPQSPGVPPDWCETYGEGSDCPSYSGYGLGECLLDGEGDLGCTQDSDTAACEGLALGDACATDRAGVVVNSRCSMQGDAALFCPYSTAEVLAACDGLVEYAACETGTFVGNCYRSAQGVLGCLDTSAYYEGYQVACADHTEGSSCTIQSDVYPSVGLCEDGAAWGMLGLVCFPGGIAYSEHGGVDGINVDACENLYVTEYIQGEIWRFDNEGAEAQEVAKVRASWIPNMHWGNGVGGWERDTLYVMERDQGGVYALPVGIEGHGDAWDPASPQ